MTELTQLISEARAAGDYQRAEALVPYASMLGIAFEADENGRLLFRLEYNERNIGNSLLPALHGGAIAAFMEHAALLELVWNQETVLLPKVIDFSIDYLRRGRPETVFAECHVIRQGQRVANVSVTAWQGDRNRIIATGRCHYLLTRSEDEQR